MNVSNLRSENSKPKENEVINVLEALFPGATIPEIPGIRKQINIMRWRIDEMAPFQRPNVHETPNIYADGVVSRLDLSEILVSALPVYLRDKKAKKTLLPNNSAISRCLEEGEKMSGALKHNYFEPYGAGDYALRILGAGLLKDKYADMRLTTVGVVDAEGKPTALIQYYRGGGGRGRDSRSFDAVMEPTSV